MLYIFPYSVGIYILILFCNHSLYLVPFHTSFNCTSKWSENHALYRVVPSGSIPSYFDITDSIPHAATFYLLINDQ